MRFINLSFDNFNIKHLIGIFFLVTIFGLYSDELRAEELINPHDFTKEALCVQCHIEGSRDLRHDEITVCFRCHSENLADHVIDVKPRRALVPAGWYMSSDGRMVCYSCHDYHHKSTIRRVLWVEYERLCMLCHVGY
jgi:predicted CXXCH cytochrome family protein